MTRSSESSLTAESLRSILHYDPETGVFTWVSNVSFNPLAGKKAGTDDWRGYISIRVAKVKHKAHRLAWLYMTGSWPKCVIDHINSDTLDNRWVNLREASFSQNQANRRISKNNSSGFKGVYLRVEAGRSPRWCAVITFCGKKIRVGQFSTKEEAAAAYARAALKYFGEYARAA